MGKVDETTLVFGSKGIEKTRKIISHRFSNYYYIKYLKNQAIKNDYHSHYCYWQKINVTYGNSFNIRCIGNFNMFKYNIKLEK